MNKRKNIGSLITDIDGNYESLYWNYVRNAVNRFGCNLIALEGRELSDTSSTKIQHNSIYNIATIKRLDGLLVSSGLLLSHIGYGEFLTFLMRFEDIPTVSVGHFLDGITSIAMDNKRGMKSVVEHVVKDHGCRRVAFLKGPRLSIEAQDRFKSYIDVLTENKIEIDNNIIFDGNFESESGYRLLNEITGRNLNFDALVCANDEMALGVLKAARELKLNVPDDFIITGFDDTLGSRIMSITTLRQPLDTLTERAVEVLLDKIKGTPVKDIEFLPGKLIKRESCGCSIENNTINLPTTGNVRVTMRYKIHENLQTYSVDELFNQITTALKEFNIRSCFIVKYSESIFNIERYFILPEKSQLIYAYYDGKHIDINGKLDYFNTYDIIPHEFFPEDRLFTYLVEPLFFKSEHFGYVVFEVGNTDIVCYESLRGQISNTLKGAFLLTEREKLKEKLSEKERLASLGHLIGGISHNLNTPIMSISGVCMGLEELIKETRDSIGDPSVTPNDYKEIAGEMSEWLTKLKGYLNYISNIITDVGRQAIQLNESTHSFFSIDELIGGINLLLKNNSNPGNLNLNLNVDVDPKTVLSGEAANLIQVIYNIVNNAFQSYEGLEDTKRIVDLSITHKKNDILFAIKDYGIGISDNVKSKIFKQMVTTKGKNGTGLSLLLSYSTVLGKFNGQIWFDTSLNQGSTFFISIPAGQK